MNGTNNEDNVLGALYVYSGDRNPSFTRIWVCILKFELYHHPSVHSSVARLWTIRSPRSSKKLRHTVTFTPKESRTQASAREAWEKVALENRALLTLPGPTTTPRLSSPGRGCIFCAKEGFPFLRAKPPWDHPPVALRVAHADERGRFERRVVGDPTVDSCEGKLVISHERHNLDPASPSPLQKSTPFLSLYFLYSLFFFSFNFHRRLSNPCLIFFSFSFLLPSPPARALVWSWRPLTLPESTDILCSPTPSMSPLTTSLLYLLFL